MDTEVSAVDDEQDAAVLTWALAGVGAVHPAKGLGGSAPARLGAILQASPWTSGLPNPRDIAVRGTKAKLSQARQATSVEPSK